MTAPEPAAERVWRTVRAEILDGTRPGGSRLSERALADEYGVSRIPVRTAIRRLRQEGLIDQPDYRRLVVHTMSRADASELTELLETLDLHAVRLAAVRRSEEDVVAFQNLLKTAERASAKDDASEVNQAGLALRSRVFAASGSLPLQEIEAALAGQFQRSFQMTDPHLLKPLSHMRLTVEYLAEQKPELAANTVHSLLKSKREAQQQRIMTLLRGTSLDDAHSQPRFDSQPISRPFDAEPEFSRTLDAVRRQIILGERPAGSAISERLLASDFAISRLPALQAIEVLVHEGLVTPGTARSSSVVRSIEADEAADVYDVCIVLDLLSIRLATERRSRRDLSELQALLSRELATDPTDAQARIDRMFEFRAKLFEMSGNRWLGEADRIVSSRLRLLVRDAPLTPERLRGHEFLYDAIARRDASLSEAVYREIFAKP